MKGYHTERPSLLDSTLWLLCDILLLKSHLWHHTCNITLVTLHLWHNTCDITILWFFTSSIETFFRKVRAGDIDYATKVLVAASNSSISRLTLMNYCSVAEFKQFLDIMFNTTPYRYFCWSLFGEPCIFYNSKIFFSSLKIFQPFNFFSRRERKVEAFLIITDF